MNLIIKNQTDNSLSYAQGQVTVGPKGTTPVPREYNVLVTGDAAFLNDATAGNIIVNNGAGDLSGPSIILLAQSLAIFAATPLATMPLYYSLPIQIRQSAGTAASKIVWAMRNDAASQKIVTVERIFLQMGFDAGTPLGRSLQRYSLRRFTTAAPTGGTAINPVPMDTQSPATVITDARFLDTGLTNGNLVLSGDSIAVIGCPASDGSTVPYERKDIPIKLAAGEGLAIVLEVAAVVGQDLTGEVIWAER